MASHIIWPGIRSFILTDIFADYLNNCKNLVELKDIKLIAITWWFVWITRNSIIFLEETYCPAKAAALVSSFIQNLDKSLVDDLFVFSVSEAKVPIIKGNHILACWDMLLLTTII